MAKFLGSFESGSADWLALREGSAVVTGTLVGQILGMNPWESAFTAWAKATGKIPNEVKQSRAMRLGQLLEAPIVQLWGEENPDYKIQSEVGTWAHDDFDWARANPDGLLTWPDGSQGILEIKTSRVPFDEVPSHYRAQVLWYCFVMGATKAKLVALFSGNDLREFDIEFDQWEFDAMFAAVERWRDCVLNDTKPDWDGSASTFETVKAINPDVSDTAVDLGDLGVHVQNAQSDFDKAAELLTELKSRTIDALGEAKSGFVTVGGEQYVVCTRSVNRNGVVSLTIKKGQNV
jgi:putative phage-type endonuclease